MAFHQQADGRRIYFEHFTGPKTAFVLSHGWGMSSRIWIDVIERLLRAGHEVLTIDHRGCGQSDRDFEDMSIKALAGDIVDIVKARNLRPAIINGWSLGGAVAVEAAHRLGNQAAALVLTCGATPRYTQASDFPYGGQRADVLATPDAILADRATFFKGLTQAVFAKEMPEPFIHWIWSIFMDIGPNAITSLMDLADLDQREMLKSLNIPVLSIIGDKDVIVPPQIGEMAGKLAPKGQVAVFEGCGHAPFAENAERYVQTLIDFAQSL